METKKLLMEDLEQIKQKDPGKDQPLRILTKEEIKEHLGRSTDVGDSVMMRMFFIVNKNKLNFAFISTGREKPINQIDKEEKKEEEKRKEETEKQIKEGKISFGPSSWADEDRKKTNQLSTNV